MAEISIIIPTYKTSEYFRESLCSISSQSFSNYEIIIILNGCKEPYSSKIINWINEYNLQDKTRLIQIDKPGVSNARNIGIDNANGEYITFMDDDDLLSENYIEDMIKLASPDKEIICNVLKFQNNKNNIIYDPISEGYKNLHNLKSYSIFKIRRMLNSPFGRLIPRNLITDIRFNSKNAYGEDAIFNFEKSKRIKKYIFTDDSVIYYYRQNPASVSNKKGTATFWLKHTFRGIKSLMIIYFKNPFSYNFFYFMSRVAGFVFFGIKHLHNLKS